MQTGVPKILADREQENFRLRSTFGDPIMENKEETEIHGQPEIV